MEISNISDLQKRIVLIDALKGAGFNGIKHAVRMEEAGYAYFNGNGHNESWAWKKDVLASLTQQELLDLYFESKGW